jgi:hydrogenase maturation protease
MDEKRPYLLYAYGNPGRLDDGLGPACARAFEALALPQLTVESDYQLTVEDAWIVAGHETVIFVDASMDAPAPFTVEVVEARASSHFTSHMCDAATVLATAREALEATPHAFLLAIRGYEFHAYGEQLSEGALRNLSKANEFLREVFEGGGVEKLLLAASLNRSSQGSERGGEVKP